MMMNIESGMRGLEENSKGFNNVIEDSEERESCGGEEVGERKETAENETHITWCTTLRNPEGGHDGRTCLDQPGSGDGLKGSA